MRVKTNYTRKQLIEICEKAIVKETEWRDRDSGAAHINVGTCWALLKAGCKFTIKVDDSACSTDEETIWVSIQFKGFQTFEFDSDSALEEDTRYLPTQKRLNKIEGGDWY